MVQGRGKLVGIPPLPVREVPRKEWVVSLAQASAAPNSPHQRHQSLCKARTTTRAIGGGEGADGREVGMAMLCGRDRSSREENVDIVLGGAWQELDASVQSYTTFPSS